jgi:MATE family multidrug resistance protein
MLLIASAYVLIPDLFIRPFAARTDPEIFSEIYKTSVFLLRFVAVYSLFDAMNIVFASAIKGAGDTRFVMFMLLGLSSLFLVIPTYAAVVLFNQGLTVCWVIATTYIILLGVCFFLRFSGGKWQTMRVIERPL